MAVHKGGRRRSGAKKRAGAYHHGDLRGALLDKTLQLIAHKGVDGFSLRDVARGLRVSEAAPYHHFQSKAHLIVHAALLGYHELAPRLQASIDDAPDEPYEQLRAFAREYVRFGLEDEGRFRSMFGAHMLHARSAATPAELAVGARAYAPLAQIAATIAAAEGAPERREALERVLWSTAHGVVTLLLGQELRFEDGASVDDLIDDMTQMLCAGVRSVAQRRP